MALYRKATEEPYSFMFIRLDAKTRRDMFWLRWEARLVPEDPAVEESDDERLAIGQRTTEPIHEPRPRTRRTANGTL